MRAQKSLRPRLEWLETKIAMSTGAATTPAAALLAASNHGPAALALQSAGNDRVLELAQIKTIRLAGQASGTYTSSQTNPDTGTKYQINKASGTITPIGAAVVTGSFRTPGFINGGGETGTLTITGPHGTLYLKLTESISPVAARSSRRLINSVNPGGPMIPAGTQSTGSGPIILVNSFDYRIVAGTGQYARDRGTGVVHITSTPGLASPTGPGIYATASAGLTSTGRIALTFLTNSASA